MIDAKGMYVSQLELQAGGRCTYFKAFYETVKIRLLKFLASFSEELDAIGDSEDPSVHNLTYFLEEEGKGENDGQMSDVEDEFGGERSPRNIVEPGRS